MTTRSQSLSETGKTQICPRRSGISWNDHYERDDKSGPYQTSWNLGLANTEHSETNMLLSRIWKLLQMIYLRIHTSCMTPSRFNEEE